MNIKKKKERKLRIFFGKKKVRTNQSKNLTLWKESEKRASLLPKSDPKIDENRMPMVLQFQAAKRLCYTSPV